MDTPAIDRLRLTMLRAPHGPDEPDVLQQLVDSFVTNATQRLVRLHEAAATGNVKTIAHEARMLKGLAATLGAKLVRSV